MFPTNRDCPFKLSGVSAQVLIDIEQETEGFVSPEAMVDIEEELRKKDEED